MKLIIEFDPDKDAIAEAMSLLEQVRDLLFGFTGLLQREMAERIEGVELEMQRAPPPGVQIGGDHLPPVNYAGFKRDWQDFCAKYQMPLRTYRAVQRNVGHDSEITLTEFLSAGREYWVTYRNVGEKGCNDIQDALDKAAGQQ